MLVAIAVLRASGVLNVIVLGFENFFAFLGIDTDFVPAAADGDFKAAFRQRCRA